MTGGVTISPTISDRAFDALAKIAQHEAGLHLPQSKKAFVFSRLQKRLRHLKLNDFDAYCSYLQGDAASAQSERLMLVSQLTTNVTQFFREAHHFDHLRDTLLPKLTQIALGGGRVRLWSAGCSTGHEPFSMALTCLDYEPRLAQCDFRILATDIDPVILKEAQNAKYSSADRPKDFEALFARWIRPIGPNHFSFVQEVRELVSFRRLNLVGDWPFEGLFDVIFCRNVVIYFDGDTQKTVVRRLASALRENGTLFLGHSERPPTTGPGCFDPVALTTYQINQI